MDGSNSYLITCNAQNTGATANFCSNSTTCSSNCRSINVANGQCSTTGFLNSTSARSFSMTCGSVVSASPSSIPVQAGVPTQAVVPSLLPQSASTNGAVSSVTSSIFIVGTTIVATYVILGSTLL